MHIERDQELLHGLAANDDKSLETIYLENFPAIARMVMQNNGSEDDAKDIFQEAMIVLYEKVQEGGFVLSSRLKTFLYSVCRRLWLKKLQSSSLSAPLFGELEETTAAEDALEAHLERDRQFKQMEEAMGKIGEPCKTILEDYYIHRQSMQDIAERFGYTNAENAKNQKYKCLMRLKKLFFAPYK
ncbi:RNA polymerase sigma factor [Chitinophaga sp. GCM10012297]|uniref:Sigma-70 family RNA polymerase sigma factor n=1 Tax=Chitinophaga chungangae TaxID=2821488 RepID=A0ABS3Y8W9_9BACT|nr:sigma-70 family RNA polymerase sigma factor [Chitinophaga chungangae]MBO9151124.1 sigma-70 family RNA polymerase sigma factor [Chitinophaga chungangae]